MRWVDDFSILEKRERLIKLLRVCLNIVYFIEIENLLLKVL